VVFASFLVKSSGSTKTVCNVPCSNGIIPLWMKQPSISEKHSECKLRICSQILMQARCLTALSVYFCWPIFMESVRTLISASWS
jgi:hypothetical protein